MGKKPEDDLRSTIGDDDWGDLKDRANKANPNAGLLDDPEAIQRRKMANANFENRENN